MERNSLDRLDDILEQALEDDDIDEVTREVVELGEKTKEQRDVDEKLPMVKRVEVFYWDQRPFSIKKVTIYPKSRKKQQYLDLGNAQSELIKLKFSMDNSLKWDDFVEHVWSDKFKAMVNRFFVEEEPEILDTFNDVFEMKKAFNKKYYEIRDGNIQTTPQNDKKVIKLDRAKINKSREKGVKVYFNHNIQMFELTIFPNNTAGCTHVDVHEKRALGIKLVLNSSFERYTTHHYERGVIYVRMNVKEPPKKTWYNREGDDIIAEIDARNNVLKKQRRKLRKEGNGHEILDIDEILGKEDGGTRRIYPRGVKIFYRDIENATLKEVLIFPITDSCTQSLEIESPGDDGLEIILKEKFDEYVTNEKDRYFVHVKNKPKIARTFATKDALVGGIDIIKKEMEARRESLRDEDILFINDMVLLEMLPFQCDKSGKIVNNNNVIKLKIKGKTKLDISDDEIEKKYNLSVKSFRGFIQKHLSNHELIYRFYEKARGKPSDLVKILCGLFDNRKNVVTAYIPGDDIEKDILYDLIKLVSGFKNYKVDKWYGEQESFPDKFEYDGKNFRSTPAQKYPKDLETLLVIKFLKKIFKKYSVHGMIEKSFIFTSSLLRANNPAFTLSVFKFLWWAISSLKGEHIYTVRGFIKELSLHHNPAVIFLLAKALYWKDKMDCDLDLGIDDVTDEDFRKEVLSRIASHWGGIADHVAKPKLFIRD